MSIARPARVVKRAVVLGTRVAAVPLPAGGRAARRLAKEAVDASLYARRILEDAQAEAAGILRRAREDAVALAANAAEEAHRAEVARLAGQFLALRAEDARRAERDLDRAIELARVLAERLLGEALAIDPARVAALARQTLLEARGAKHAVIDAGPLDAETLKGHVGSMGLPEGALEIRIDTTLPRGSLRVTTNLGTLDAQLTPQLERLAEALRDALA